MCSQIIKCTRFDPLGVIVRACHFDLNIFDYVCNVCGHKYCIRLLLCEYSLLYHICSHIASDGPDDWSIDEPKREDVLDRMSKAIKGWDLNSERNINYRSFEPILGLLKCFETSECQLWAVVRRRNHCILTFSLSCSIEYAFGSQTLTIPLHFFPWPTQWALANLTKVRNILNSN